MCAERCRPGLAARPAQRASSRARRRKGGRVAAAASRRLRPASLVSTRVCEQHDWPAGWLASYVATVLPALLRPPLDASIPSAWPTHSPPPAALAGRLIVSEDRAVGSVPWRVYGQLALRMGLPLTLLIAGARRPERGLGGRRGVGERGREPGVGTTRLQATTHIFRSAPALTPRPPWHPPGTPCLQPGWWPGRASCCLGTTGWACGPARTPRSSSRWVLPARARGRGGGGGGWQRAELREPAWMGRAGRCGPAGSAE